MTIRYCPRLVAAALATSAVALVAFATPALASGPAGNPNAATFEKTFLSETVDHHYMGVQMGRLCMDKARSGRLAGICTAIVVNQGSEIVRMRDDFLLDWYGVEKHPMLMPADQADLRKLAKLRGKRFDIALARMFIDHHKVQIGRSATCVSQAEHHALKHVCMDQIDTQTAEIGQFRRVLRSYGK